MKRIMGFIIFLVIMLTFAGTGYTTGQWSPLWSKKQPGGMFGVIDTSKTTGDIWYVGSVKGTDGAGYGRNPQKPMATLDYLIEFTTADAGDVVYVVANHAETLLAVDAVDIDKAGLRIVGLGEGANRPTFTFGHADAEFVIGAANVTVENIRFLAGITGITIGIAVEDAGDNFTMKNCVFPEPTDSADDFIDAIDLENDANGVSIIGNQYYHTGATGPAHFLEMGNGANDNLSIIDNDIQGQFSVAAIWSNDADLNARILNNRVVQMTAGEFAIEFTGNATGFADGNRVYTNAEATSVDFGIMGIGQNTTVTAADVSGAIYPVKDTGWGKIGDFTGDGGAGQDDSVIASLDLAHTDLDAILASVPSGMSYSATVTSSADTTHSVYTALIGHGTDFFVTGWTMIVLWDAGGVSGAPEGEVVDVSAYATATGTFTHGATTALAAGDKVLFVRDELVSMFQKALPTTPVTNSLAYRISQYLASGDGDWAGGTPLASNKSIVDALGQTGADVTVTPDRNAAVIQERIDAITTVMQMVDPAGANGWEDDGSGGNLYSTFNGTDASANLFSGDGGTDKDDNVFSYFAQLERMSEEILSGLRASGKSIGDIFYVDSTSGAGGNDGTTWALAEATVDQGVSDCTASQACVVFVAPAHAEALGAAQIAMDIIGVTAIALGTGSEKSTITFDDALSSIDITVAGVTVQGFRLISDTINTTIGIDIAAGGDYAVLDGLEVLDSGGFEFDDVIVLASGADNVTVKNSDQLNTTAGGNSFMNITAGIVANLTLENNELWGDYTNAGIHSDKANTNTMLRGNTIRNIQAGDHAVQLSAASTGYAMDNTLAGTVPGQIFDSGSLLAFGNKIIESDMTDAPDNAWVEDGKWFYATATFELDATATTDDLFTVTGSVEVKVYGSITETLTSHGDTISIGTADSVALLIAATAGNAPLSNGDTWTSATVAKSAAAPSTHIVDDDNIGITQSATNLADGTVVVHVYWRALTEGASVIPI